MQKTVQTLCVLLIAVFVTGLTGCPNRGTPAKLSVSGTVTFDGKEFGDATMTLVPETPGREPVTVTTSPHGYFMIFSTSGQEGCPPGRYKVAVTAPGFADLPQKYNDAETSGLTVDVKNDGKPLDINLTK